MDRVDLTRIEKLVNINTNLIYANVNVSVTEIFKYLIYSTFYGPQGKAATGKSLKCWFSNFYFFRSSLTLQIHVSYNYMCMTWSCIITLLIICTMWHVMRYTSLCGCLVKSGMPFRHHKDTLAITLTNDLRGLSLTSYGRHLLDYCVTFNVFLVLIHRGTIYFLLWLLMFHVSELANTSSWHCHRYSLVARSEQGKIKPC